MNLASTIPAFNRPSTEEEGNFISVSRVKNDLLFEKSKRIENLLRFGGGQRERFVTLEMGCSFLNLFRGVEADGNFMRVILWVFFLVGIQAHVRNKVRLEIQLPAEAELTQAAQHARHICTVSKIESLL